MKKIIGILLISALVGICLMSLAACGSGGNGTAQSIVITGEKSVSEIAPGSITEVPEGYVKVQKDGIYFFVPASWQVSNMSNVVMAIDSATGSVVTVTKDECAQDYVHKPMTLDTFDSTVAEPMRAGGYKVSNVRALGSGYFAMDVETNVKMTQVVRLDYDETTNCTYALMATVLDNTAQNVFFGSFGVEK